MRSRESTVQSRRLVTSVLTVCAVVAAVALTGGSPQPAPDASSGFSFDAVLEDGVALGPDEVLDRACARLDAGLASAPDGTVGGVGLPAGARDIRIAADGSVVGYVVNGDCGTVLESIAGVYEDAGWARVDLGGIEGCTFIEEGGSGGWALVTANQVGDATSVVVRSMGT